MKVLLNLIAFDGFVDRAIVIQWTLQYFDRHRDDHCIIISSGEITTKLPNVHQLILHPPANKFLFALWKKTKLEPAIKKQKCNVVVSWEFVKASVSAIQLFIISPINILRENNKKQFLKKLKFPESLKANTSKFIVFSQLEKDWIIQYRPDLKNNLHVVYQVPLETIVPIEFEQKEMVRHQWSGSNEFFLAPAGIKPDQLTLILKGFSGFKKWQKSNMELLLSYNATEEADTLQKLLENYRFKVSIKLISIHDEEYRQVLSSAYAVILPDKYDHHLHFLFTAIHAEVPVIIPTGSVYEEVIGEAGMRCNMEDKAAVTSAFLQIFKEETLRSRQIQLAKEMAGKFAAYDPAEEFFGYAR